MKTEDWTRFLKWLNPDPDLAAQIYEAIRQKLISYFIRRACSDSEGLADQTIDRVIRLLSSLNGSLPDNQLRYCYGIAKYIHREYWRIQVNPNRGTVTDREPNPYRAESAEGHEVIEKCLYLCLQKLDERKRETFIRYYLTETQAKNEFRQQLADKLGITINALRLQMLRLKTELRICITECQQHDMPGRKNVMKFLMPL
jgi:RNA polymerase sigma factor (sigma-70 family)